MSVDSPPAGSEPLSPPSLIGQILDGRYRIIRKLGEGGMGEVFAAEHVHIEKRFAIKLLRPEIVSNPEAVTRFRQEARSSSSIGHRNIIAIEDFGQLADGRIYMCMELLNGAALNDLITQPVGVDRLLNILIQTGHGLAAAHAKGIIHRDMKPENIFVTIGPGGEDVPKLLDFGIAKVAGNDGQNNLTRTGTIFGTPFYMAPEQALGNPVDARTDIYAVGVIMYECFAGSLPFQGDSFMGILTQHITMDPEPVAQRAARAGRQLPAGLADVITCCMQKNPAQRFSTMDELVNVLVQIYRGILGPGMSSYMEAFPVLPSAAHQVQPTPPPMTGPVPITGPQGVQISGGHHISGSTGAVAGASGVYTTPAPPRSKIGMIIAILAVLAVGGGVAAMVVLSKKKPGPDPGRGSGSVVIAGNDGSDRGSSQGQGGRGSAGGISDLGSGSARGSAVTAGSGSAEQGSGAQGSDGPGSATQGSAAGSDAGSNARPPIEVVQVVLVAKNARKFSVYEDGVQLEDSDVLDVPKGGQRKVVIKAPGFKDKLLILEGRPGARGRPVKHEFRMDKLPGGGSSTPTDPPPHVTPPPQLNCTNKLVDPRNLDCKRQFCSNDDHITDPHCME